MWRLTSVGQDHVRALLGLPAKDVEITNDVASLTTLVSKLSDADIADYLAEAVRCLQVDALRATVVFVWAAAVKKLQARGGKIVFIRFPMTADLKELETRATPRAGPWTRIINESGAPGIYFEDYPELASFDCPEWSHLSAPDSVEFSKRLVPHLRDALKR